jgi:dual 3',5'-cyclic-AMP and -GMP phosphodiesterase 11
MARQSVALEVMSYHASASIEEVQRIKKLPIPELQSYGLIDFKFSDFSLDDDNTLCATTRMFIELDLINKFHIPYEVFLRWMLSVKKNYRAVAYHNWRHAFNVTQTMFTMVAKSQRMKSVLGDLERLALIVGALCHDLDHRGTNNQFQIKIMSPLAQLYSTSVMERHHFDHCIMILSTKGNDILSNLSKDDYHRVISLLEEAILATDLALYFKHRDKFFRIVDSGTMDWSNPSHCELIRSMMMTACDLSAITKPWQVQKKVAELIASEFFEQGDIEKNELNIKPIDMMDREKQSELPRMQIGFIDTICMPVYQAFARLGEEFEPLLIGCQENRQHWQLMAEGRVVDEKQQQDDKKHLDENEDDNHLMSNGLSQST